MISIPLSAALDEKKKKIKPNNNHGKISHTRTEASLSQHNFNVEAERALNTSQNDRHWDSV